MQSLPSALGHQAYDRLRGWLDSPAVRAQHVMRITAGWWWPEGPPASARVARRALKRAARGASPEAARRCN